MGGGIGMGNTCKPIAVSFQCMTKSTTNKKRKKKEKKRNMKKKSMSQPAEKFHYVKFQIASITENIIFMKE